MYNKVTDAEIKALIEIAGEENVIIGDSISPDYGHDELGGIEKMPEVLVRVNTTEQISAIMKLAYEKTIPVTVRGSGTGLVGSAVPVEGGILLETTQMNKILELDTNIRTSSTSAFNAQEAYENAFEDAMLEVVSKAQEEKENKMSFCNLGAPAGFFLDTSLLSEEDKLDINCCTY